MLRPYLALMSRKRPLNAAGRGEVEQSNFTHRFDFLHAIVESTTVVPFGALFEDELLQKA